MTDPDDTHRTRTDVVDRGREWLELNDRLPTTSTAELSMLDVIRDLLAEVERLRQDKCRDLDTIARAEKGWRDAEREVEALRAERVRLCKLVAELWSNADDWHGGRASSHYRSDLMDRGVRAALEESDGE